MEQLFLVGLNHRTANVDVRECFALTSAPLPDLRTLPSVREFYVLSTCNRVELLVAGDESAPADALRTWAEACGRCSADLAPYTYALRQEEAVHHVLSVASSLDSMILGEPQILGQMKEAYRQAVERGSVGALVNRLLHKAFYTAKRVRTETGVASSAVSISYAAVELAKRIFDTMSTCRAMLIGAGEMAELAATHLMQAGVRQMTVVNRTLSRAEELARAFNARAATFESLAGHLAEADIIISSTGAVAPVITVNTVRGVLGKRRNRPMFFIDIAVPRDIETGVNTLDNVYVYDIDDLNETVAENTRQRQEEARRAERIVRDECAAFMAWYDSLNFQPTIVDLVHRHEAYAEEELARTVKRLGDRADAETVQALQAMLASLVRKINHAPISCLKAAHHEDSVQHTQLLAFTRRLFALDK